MTYKLNYEKTTEPEDAYDESIKVLAEDLIKNARKLGHVITPKRTRDNQR